MQRPHPTQTERTFGEDEIIVSKTDLKGRLLYANEVFCRVGLYQERDLVKRLAEFPRVVAEATERRGIPFIGSARSARERREL